MYALTRREFATPRGKPVTMVYREDTNDFNTLFSCLNEDEYGLAALNLSGHAIDIGAYIGGVTIALALDNPGLHVTAVEPVPGNVELLRSNVDLAGVSGRVTIVDGAAGKPRQKMQLVSYGYRGDPNLEHHAFVGNSTLAGDKPTPFEHDVRRAPASSLAMLTGDGASFLKIDCEGCEWGVLTDPAVSRIERIVGEVHPTGGHSPLHLAALLQDTHDVTFSGPPAGPCGFSAVLR